LADWVESLPGPAWWPYGLLGLILLTAQLCRSLVSGRLSRAAIPFTEVI
jgi:hypothetical protein